MKKWILALSVMVLCGCSPDENQQRLSIINYTNFPSRLASIFKLPFNSAESSQYIVQLEDKTTWYMCFETTYDNITAVYPVFPCTVTNQSSPRLEREEGAR